LPGGLKLCALAKKCAGKPMVSCLMGDSTALASAIVRCCHKIIARILQFWCFMQKMRILDAAFAF
ncbi:hypothetical protein, partial [Hominenteromicrobium sp.]|uniref:hypothetical protein n=1 Tax=Hominenteromicrobium sp. TaxID=3073581 RepID=UPI003AB88997